MKFIIYALFVASITAMAVLVTASAQETDKPTLELLYPNDIVAVDPVLYYGHGLYLVRITTNVRANFRQVGPVVIPQVDYVDLNAERIQKLRESTVTIQKRK